MKTYIALLRGINVGGHKKVPMEELREILTQAGLVDVQTYIQSGNVIFKYKEEKSEKLEAKIHKAILSKFGFEVPIFVKTPQALHGIFNACPFSSEEKEKSYFMLFNKAPNLDMIDELQKIEYENESFKITKECIYFYASQGYGRTKFNSNFFERKLQVISTARNYKTMIKLLSLSS
jgi:uncharacterized protein (DUF1697 family)